MARRLSIRLCVCLSVTWKYCHHTGWNTSTLIGLESLLFADANITDLQGGPKNLAPFFLHALTLPNINRFSKLFYCQNQEKICNNTVTKDHTTPHVCRYTTL